MREQRLQITRRYTWQRLAARYLPGSIAIASLTFLGWQLYKHYDLLRAQEIHFLPLWTFLSIFPLILSYFFVPYVWMEILRSIGIHLSFWKAFEIQYISHLGKYIPGKIWSYVIQVIMANQVDIPAKKTFFSLLMLTYIMSITSIMVFSLTFLLWEKFALFTRGAAVCGVFSLSLLLCWSHLPEKWLSLLLTRIRGISIDCAPLPYGLMTLFLLGSWTLFALGFHLMLKTFYPVTPQQTVIVVGIFAISWLAGYYAFFMPGGLGVQEGVQVALLTLFFPVPVAVLIAFASRLWMTGGDLCISFLALGRAYGARRMQRAMYGSPS